jgi:hypothetical protein
VVWQSSRSYTAVLISFQARMSRKGWREGWRKDATREVCFGGSGPGDVAGGSLRITRWRSWELSASCVVACDPMPAAATTGSCLQIDADDSRLLLCRVRQMWECSMAAGGNVGRRAPLLVVLEVWRKLQRSRQQHLKRERSFSHQRHLLTAKTVVLTVQALHSSYMC